MATRAYVEDVLSLASALRESDRGRAVLEAAPPATDADAVTVDIRVDADELRPAIAVQQALQLCVDAAALCVEIDATEDSRELSHEYATAFLAENPVDLVVIDLGLGSFRARISINPKTKAGRSRLLAIGGLAAIGLVATGVLAPVGMTVAGGLALLNQISPDDKPPVQVPLQTIDSADAGDAEITIEGGGFAYEIHLNGSPDAVAAFLSWIGKLDSFRALEHPESESSESDLLRIWLTERLDQGLVDAVTRELGIEISRIAVL